MKKKLLIIFFIIFAVSFFIIFINKLINKNTSQNLNIQNYTKYDKEEFLSKEKIIQDRDELIEHLENIHPYFELEKDLSLYEEAKNNYINNCSQGMSVKDFLLLSSAFLSVLNDAHTRFEFTYTNFFDVNFTYKNDKIYLAEKGSPVKKIDGINIIKIMNLIDTLFPSENEILKQVNYTTYLSNYDILSFLEKDIPNQYISVELENGKIFQFSKYKLFTENKESSIRIQNNVIIIDLNSCIWDKTYEKICEELKNYLKSGFTNVIIDVRGNKGGDSQVCTNLLNVLGIKEPEYSVYVKYSEEAKKQNKYDKSKGNFFYKGNTNSKKNSKIKLCVLTDKETFSSATMLAVYVKDGKSGIIVGEASSNSPTSYGDIIYFCLKNSKLTGTISHKKFYRPNINNLETVLEPDEYIRSDYALERALLLLR